MLIIGTKQVADMLGVSEATVRRLELIGKLPPATRPGLGRCRRWDHREIEAWLKGRERFDDHFPSAPPADAAG